MDIKNELEKQQKALSDGLNTKIGEHDFLDRQIRQYRSWQYKNTALLIFGLAAFFLFADTQIVQSLIQKIGSWGYVGAFFAGALMVSTFTIAPALFVIYSLVEALNPYEIAIFAGFGAVLGDYMIFRFLKDRVFHELSPIFQKLGGSYTSRIFRTPYFAWLLPVVGAIMIAAPVIPDEAGIGILGLSKMKSWQFLIISFLLNASGILIISILARAM